MNMSLDEKQLLEHEVAINDLLDKVEELEQRVKKLEEEQKNIKYPSRE